MDRYMLRAAPCRLRCGLTVTKALGASDHQPLVGDSVRDCRARRVPTIKWSNRARCGPHIDHGNPNPAQDRF